MRLVALLAGLLVAAPADSAPAPHGLVAYQSTRGIEIVRPDGTGTRLLAGSRPGDQDPRWSPDGRRIAVWRDPGDLAVFDLAGHRRVVTDDAWADQYPVWTADGARI